jgi:LuxR family maltose regulon positive regulatory protein
MANLPKNTDPFVLLKTKFQRPRLRENIVARPRLLEKLQDCLKQSGQFEDLGFARKLILVSAPAGYGKTTAVGQWLEICPYPCAWLSLDEGDSDPNVFLTYLTGAIRTAYPEACAITVSLLKSHQLLPTHYLVNTLINELAELPGKLVLALDDFHLIDGEVVPKLVLALLEHLTSKICLVIATRQDPTFPITHIRAAGDMVELRMAELCFSHPEVQEFLEAAVRPGLSPKIVKALEEHTEGWIVGLRLAALSLRGVDDLETFVEDFQGSGHRYVMEYLVDQVLSHQTSEVQNFLLVTSILDRFCLSLCDTLIEEQDNRAILNQINQENLFLVSLDIEGDWFRYHHLFQELLRHRLQSQIPSDKIAAFHSKASTWFVQNEFIEEALIHALAADDEIGAARLVETNYRQAVNQGQWSRLQRWVDRFSESAIERRPGLLLAHCWCLHRAFKLEATVPVFERAAGFLETPDLRVDLDIDEIEQNHLLGEINGLRSQVLYFLGEHELGRTHAEQSLEQLTPEFSYGVSGAMLYLDLHLHVLGHGEKALRQLNQTIRSQPKGSPASMHLYNGLCYINRALADFSRFLKAGQNYLLAAQKADILESVAFAHYQLGVAYYEWNKLETAQSHLEENLVLRFYAHEISYHSSLQVLALVYLKQNQMDKLQKLILAMQELEGQTESHLFIDGIHSFQARLALYQDDLESADRLSLAAYNGPPLGPMLLFEIPAITRAKFLVAQATLQSTQEALDLLDELLVQARETHYVWREIEILALQALALNVQGNLDEALSSLEQSVTLAEPGRLIRTFVDLGPQLVELLRRLSRTGGATNYLNQLLAAFDAEYSISQNILHSEIFELLTDREAEVLALLGERLTNKEIAHRLVISPQTVKRHSSNIYQKLGVKNRREAAAKAQEMAFIFLYADNSRSLQ